MSKKDPVFEYACTENNENPENTAVFLCLSGGAFRGAFQFWVIAHLMERYLFDHIEGVSIGAGNGVFASMQKLDSLYNIWMTVNGRGRFLKIRWLYLLGYITGFVWVLNKVGIRILPGIYSMEPYMEMLKKHVDLQALQVPFSAGVVAAQGGNDLYFSLESEDMNETQDLLLALQASGCMVPFMKPPLLNLPTGEKEEEIGVDGGYWNIFPIPWTQIREARESGKKILIHAVGCTPLNRVKRVQRTKVTGLISLTLRLIEIMEAAIYDGDILQLQYAAGKNGEVRLWIPEIEPGDSFDASPTERDRRLAESKKMVERGPIVMNGIG